MAMGVKGYVNASEIKHLYVPFLHESLTIEIILAWAKTNHSEYLDHYFPVYKEARNWPRQVSDQIRE
jgi:hypothetical protein